jgi:starch synthase
MAKSLSVLLVSSEVYPFIKTSERADLWYAHALGTREVGHDLRVMVPKYGFISERKNRIHEINRLRDIPIMVGSEPHPATVKSSSINNPRVKVQAYITTNSDYLDVNKGMLHDNTTGTLFPNNDERFIFFNRTVIETCLLLGWFPDIIHCVGWETGLIPALVRTQYPAEFKKTKIVMTITDFDQQGVFPAKSIAKAGLPPAGSEAAKYKNKMNFLRAGITFADRVSTISPTVAQELLASKEFKEHWLPLLKGKPLAGIPHGLDLLQWTPKADPFVKPKFSADDSSNKATVREHLQKAVGLSVDPSCPIISFVGPLNEDRGFDLFLQSVPTLLKRNAQIIICGDHPWDFRKDAEALAKKFPKQLVVKIPFEEELLHHVIGGSTILAKPSRSEASGQYQRAAMAYGTIPVVRITGGLDEGLVDIDSPKGNAVLFKKADAKDVEKALVRALDAAGKHDEWSGIVANAMTTHVGWSLSAKPYDELYRTLMKDKE